MGNLVDVSAKPQFTLQATRALGAVGDIQVAGGISRGVHAIHNAAGPEPKFTVGDTPFISARTWIHYQEFGIVKADPTLTLASGSGWAMKSTGGRFKLIPPGGGGGSSLEADSLYVYVPGAVASWEDRIRWRVLTGNLGTGTTNIAIGTSDKLLSATVIVRPNDNSPVWNQYDFYWPNTPEFRVALTRDSGGDEVVVHHNASYDNKSYYVLAFLEA